MKSNDTNSMKCVSGPTGVPVLQLIPLTLIAFYKYLICPVYQDFCAVSVLYYYWIRREMSVIAVNLTNTHLLDFVLEL